MTDRARSLFFYCLFIFNVKSIKRIPYDNIYIYIFKYIIVLSYNSVPNDWYLLINVYL